jgi:hypothetical protein
MKRAIFVSDKSFDNYDLLSRAAAVLIQDFKDSDTEIEFVSLGNEKLLSLLISFADSTRPYLKQKGVRITTSIDRYPPWHPDPQRHDAVAKLGTLKYYPYKLFVFQAKDAGIETVEY